MQTISDIFDAFGGPSAVSRALGVNPSTASEMKRRRSIPVAYWPRLIEAAHERNIDGITYEVLVNAHALPLARGTTPPRPSNLGAAAVEVA
jgi:hypothetical protein